jgi:hypothetical protein
MLPLVLLNYCGSAYRNVLRLAITEFRKHPERAQMRCPEAYLVDCKRETDFDYPR